MIFLVLAMMAQTLPPGVAVPSPPPPKFVTRDVPNTGGSTQPRRINDQGQIVGLYGGLAQNAKGFLVSHGTFTPIDYPSSRYTHVFGINNYGDAGGIYADGKDRPDRNELHGFLYKHGVYSMISFPAAGECLN